MAFCVCFGSSAAELTTRRLESSGVSMLANGFAPVSMEQMLHRDKPLLLEKDYVYIAIKAGISAGKGV